MSLETLKKVAAELDGKDPFHRYRERFVLEEGLIYLDGNSLGPMQKTVVRRMATTLGEEWGKGLIRSWNDAGWVELSRNVARKIAPLIGTEETSVAVGDSTSVSLFKVLSGALRLAPGRTNLVSEKGNFPTDLYIAEGLADFMGRDHKLILAENNEQLSEMIDQETAIVMLTQVDFRTGRKLDMETITRHAHQNGALVIWDLAHSAGAFPVHLDECDADFAVGCGYKYLNGGPGAPAFCYVNKKHIGKFVQPLTGWFSHAAPFEFSHDYRPAPSILQMNCGTPQVLGLTALDESLDIWEGISVKQVEEKSRVMTQLFMRAVEELTSHDALELVTPKDPLKRGSQVAYRHRENAYAIVQALIARGVVGDYRDPDIARFGFAPLYLSYSEVVSAAAHLSEVLASGEWQQAEFSKRKGVT